MSSCLKNGNLKVYQVDECQFYLTVGVRLLGNALWNKSGFHLSEIYLINTKTNENCETQDTWNSYLFFYYWSLILKTAKNL